MRTLKIVTMACLLLLSAISIGYADATIPAGFNGDLALPPNAELIKGQESPPYVEVVSKDSMKEQYEFYKKDLVSKGWKIVGDYPNLDNTYQIQLKKEGKTLSIGIGEMKNGNSIARIMLM